MTSMESALRIPVGDVEVEGNMFLPQEAKALVIFVHGSGSSRFSPRNQYVAKEFNKAGMGTLLFDLLTPGEEEEDELTAQYRFDIALLSRRLIGVTEWLRNDPSTYRLKLGYFGASTGAAAALIAAAKMPEAILAVVSRGGRPDLAGKYLQEVRAPTLLLVGGDDEEVIELNKRAQAKMINENKLVVILGATHLFEEPSKIEEVSRFASDWFSRYLK
jgi:putative phosphoribosyl transferase